MSESVSVEVREITRVMAYATDTWTRRKVPVEIQQFIVNNLLRCGTHAFNPDQLRAIADYLDGLSDG